MATTYDQIAQFYQSSLGRAPEASAIDFWTQQANNGVDIGNAISKSAEGQAYAARATTPAPTPAPAPAPASSGSSVSGMPASWQFSDYNGNQVRVDDAYKSDLAASAAKAGMSAQDYDKMLNPDTYGARWGVAATTKPASTAATPTTISQSDLTYRNINANTETVKGQMQGLLAEDSQYMQLARADAQRQAADRGMLNSSMAASAGTDAAIRSALNIATPDAATYGKASDYNTALNNEILKYNADTLNQFARDERGYAHDAWKTETQNTYDWNKTQAGYGQAITLQQMQNAVERWKTEYQGGVTAGNNAEQYKQQQLAFARDIVLNNDWSPERKAVMLESLGLGTSARRDAAGNVIPGTGMAGSVYVIDSVSADLAGSSSIDRSGAPASSANWTQAQWDEWARSVDKNRDGKLGFGEAMTSNG